MWNIRNKGFTLIELLVVISIMGILGSVTLAPFNQARMKGRDGKRVSELKAIQSSLQLYADGHHGCYPDGSTAINSVNSLSADNYKYIPKTLYAKILNGNVIASSPDQIPAAWTAVKPYGYRGEGDFKECGTQITPVEILNPGTGFSLSNTTETGFSLSDVYLPSFQLITELETHGVVLDGDADSNKTDQSVDMVDDSISGEPGDPSYYFGLNLSSPTLETCTDGSVGNWDCVYDLTN